MPAKDLGTKFNCYKCQTKFYDLKKPDPICPKCGADQRESPANKPASEGRRSRLSVAKVIAPVEPVAESRDLLGEEDEEFEDEEAETASDDDEA